ncbi:hypothetical protein [Nitratidesulfovibrio liaohensis]|uniref:Uncharacterized protein n=1 Tax=Nitratidesulfovibrio liaohensis TaxID=2604158 RepID=A0ABY9R052_9BACT|nr:hypothetical protein [Nitratidesulfovibrio liaohensis]WMW64368.1 hypothetical protein KPS_002380 [Nitratidesulfovibrio liaohensis]
MHAHISHPWVHPYDSDTVDPADVRPGSVDPVAPQPSAVIVRRVTALRHELRRFRLTPGLTSGDHGRIAEIMRRLDETEDLHRSLLGFAPRELSPIHTGTKPGAPGRR